MQMHLIIWQLAQRRTYDTVVISKAADTMLSMSGVEATFVISAKEYQRLCVYFSSQSQQINVQRIMEKLGEWRFISIWQRSSEGKTVQVFSRWIKNYGPSH